MGIFKFNSEGVFYLTQKIIIATHREKIFHWVDVDIRSEKITVRHVI
jgi:hypothetical protein